jgi:AcrR family transcriptional regulator
MADRKGEIVAAAKRVLAREGSAGFSVRKVAREAGISLGNLQYHFASRIELLEGLLEADVASYREAYHELRRSSQTSGTQRRADGEPWGLTVLREFLTRALQEAGGDEDLAVFRALFTFADKEIVEALSRYDRELYSLLEAALAELCGQSPDSAQVRGAASLLYPFLDGYPTTAPALSLDHTALASLLTEVVWGILSDTT